VDYKKTLIRGAVPAIAAVAAVAAWQTSVAPDKDGKLPNEALNSEFVLRVEHGFVVFAILLFVLVVIVKGVWEGALPSKIGKEGAEYPAVADQTEKALQGVTKLGNRRWAIVSRILPLQDQRLKELEERVQKLDH
jgi:hypothetical protein